MGHIYYDFCRLCVDWSRGFSYNDIAGWGFAAVGIGFFAIAWVFNALKGRV